MTKHSPISDIEMRIDVLLLKFLHDSVDEGEDAPLIRRAIRHEAAKKIVAVVGEEIRKEKQSTKRVSDKLHEFDEKFQWHQNESWVFVNDSGKAKVRNWLVDALLFINGNAEDNKEAVRASSEVSEAKEGVPKK